MMKARFLAALATAALAVPMAARAELVTQLIHFDDAGNGWKWYSDVDRNFLFDPTNLQSAVLCADDTAPPGNGSCLIEGKQGTLPRMTRPSTGPQSQGSSNKPPVVSGEELFTLDSFYFLLTGKGTGAENAISVEGSNGKSFTFQLGGNYDALGAPDVSWYAGPDAGDLAGDLVKNRGYIASFGDLFKDVTWIQFSAPTSAQVRLDCVVATFEGTTTEPLSKFTNGCGVDGSGGDDDVPLPEPGSLALVGLGLAAAGLARRRKRAA